jgi:hypothetical protein
MLDAVLLSAFFLPEQWWPKSAGEGRGGGGDDHAGDLTAGPRNGSGLHGGVGE